MRTPTIQNARPPRSGKNGYHNDTFAQGVALGSIAKEQHTFSRSGTTPPLTCLTRPLSGEKHRSRIESRARCSYGSTLKTAAQASESGQVREHRIRQLSRLNACPRSFPSPPRNAVYRIRLAANTVTPEVGCLAGNGHPGVTNYNVSSMHGARPSDQGRLRARVINEMQPKAPTKKLRPCGYDGKWANSLHTEYVAKLLRLQLQGFSAQTKHA